MIESGLNLRAAGDLSSGSLIKQNSTNPETDVVVCAALTDIPIGVSLMDVDVSEDGPNFKYLPLEHGHLYTLVASATIAAAAPLGCAADGEVVTATSGQAYWFLAVQAASANQKLLARYVGHQTVA